MAETTKKILEIEIDVDSGDVKTLNKEVGQTKKEVKDTGEATKGLTGQLDKMTGGAITGMKNLVAGIKTGITSFKSLRLAIMATGLGALVVAIGAVTAAFTSSEEGQNKFAKIMSVIGTLTGNLVDLLADFGEVIIDVFENPQESLKSFGELIKQNLVNRFEGLVELIPQLSKAIKLLFEGEFTEAGKVAVNAVTKVSLGIDDFTGKIETAIEKTKEFGREQIREAKLAANVADMRAKADKIERDLIVERSKLESDIAELRLKSRQEDQFSAEERKNFLLEAQKLEDTLLDKETKYLQLRRDAQVLENTFSRSNKENLDKEARAIAAVNNQVAARANTARQLQRELNTINGQIQAEQNAINKAIEAEQKRLLDEEIARNKAANEKKIKDDQEAADKAIALAQKEADVKNQIQGSVFAFASLLTDQFGKKSEAAAKRAFQVNKALGIAEAVINTAKGINKALAETTDPTPTQSFRFGSAIAVGLAGALQVATIASTQFSAGASGGGSAGGVNIPTAQSQAPQFNTVGASGVNQLDESINNQNRRPTEAYVVSGNITTAQSLDRNRIDEATL
jgi:hypothetical protein